jgi:hypothetical protein
MYFHNAKYFYCLKTIKKTKILIALLLMYSVSFILIIKVGKFISIDKFPINLAYGIIFYDFSQIEKLIKFLFEKKFK